VFSVVLEPGSFPQKASLILFSFCLQIETALVGLRKEIFQSRGHMHKQCVA